MVYINARGEVVDDTRPTPKNIFWKIITFIVLFFKSLVGIEDRIDKKNDGNVRGPFPGGSSSGGSGGGGSGGPNNRPGGGGLSKRFGPKGFKSITDFPPPPPPCSGGACGL